MIKPKRRNLEEDLCMMYSSLLLLPALEGFNEDFSILNNIFLALNNKEAFLNFMILFSGKTVTIPDINTFKFYLSCLNAYDYYLKTFGTTVIDTTKLNKVMRKFKIPVTRENRNLILKINNYLKNGENNVNT